MANFGKLDFSTSFNPTSAFPLDARQYFTSLALAKAAAATAEEVGSKNTVYYYGMQLFVDDGASVKWYVIQRDRTLLEVTSNGGGTSSGGGTEFTTDETLTLKDGVLKVNTASVIEENNTLPVTSGAVYKQIGNVENLLDNI